MKNLKGKEVYPFCTSGMSGPETAVQQLKKACTGATPSIQVCV